MRERTPAENQRRTARLAGAFYLILALALFPQLLRNGVLVAHDAAATAKNLLAQADLFRLSVYADLVFQVAFVFLVLTLYQLLKDVGRQAARAMVALALVSVPLAMGSMGFELTALAQFQEGNTALGTAFLGQFQTGTQIAEIFWGLWLFPLGWLFFRSNFMPKTLGIALMVGCFGYFFDIAGQIAPVVPAVVANAAVSVSGLAEMATVGWLLVWGTKRQKRV